METKKRGSPIEIMKIKLLFVVVTVVVLGALISSCEKNSEPDVKVENSVGSDEVDHKEAKVQTLAIAIINSDTILSKYDFASELRDNLTEQSIKYQRILREKESVLMSEMQKLQAEAPTLSQFEGERRQRKLYEDQEKLRIKQDEYSQKLMVVEQQYNRDIDSAIGEFLNRYCEGKPYQMVLSNTDLGMIRWFNPVMDITVEVLTGLNEEYATQQTAQSTEEVK